MAKIIAALQQIAAQQVEPQHPVDRVMWQFGQREFGDYRADGYGLAVQQFFASGEFLTAKPPTARMKPIKLQAVEEIFPIAVSCATSKPARSRQTGLARVMEAAEIIAATHDVRYYLNGFYIDRTAGRICATDGHRAIVLKTQDFDGLPAGDSGYILGHDGKVIDANYPDIDRVMPRLDALGDCPRGSFSVGRGYGQARAVARAWRFFGVHKMAGIQVAIADGSVTVCADYLRDMAAVFARLGYSSVNVALWNNDRLICWSDDEAVMMVVMGQKNAPPVFAPVVPDCELTAQHDANGAGALAESAPTATAHATPSQPEPAPLPAPCMGNAQDFPAEAAAGAAKVAGGVYGKAPWRMTAIEWQRARDALRPCHVQKAVTRASGSQEAARHDRLQALLYGVCDAARYLLAAAGRKEVALSSDEVDALLERLETPVTHRDVVEKALHEGKAVPGEVLADYLDLIPPAPASASRGERAAHDRKAPTVPTPCRGMRDCAGARWLPVYGNLRKSSIATCRTPRQRCQHATHQRGVGESGIFYRATAGPCSGVCENLRDYLLTASINSRS